MHGLMREGRREPVLYSTVASDPWLRVQLRPPAPSLAVIAESHAVRDKAIVAAYATGAYSYRQIAEHFGLHLVTVGRIVRRSLTI